MSPDAVFQIIVDRLASNAATLGRFAETGRSFEEWVNWELFDAFVSAGISAEPKPRYADSRSLGDLLVGRAPEPRILVEVAVCTEATQSKWSLKIVGDTAKLARALSPELHTLQIVVLLAADLEANTWPRFLKAMGWDEATRHRHSSVLSTAYDGAGTLNIRGWYDYGY